MNIFQFIASMTNSVIWPIVIVITVALLKRPLSHMFLSLEKFRLNYKDKDLEVNFSKEIAKLGDEAEQAKLPDISQKQIDSSKVAKIEVQTEEDDKLKNLQKEQSTKSERLETSIIQEKQDSQQAEETKIGLELQQISLKIDKQQKEIQKIYEFIKVNNTQAIDEDFVRVVVSGPVASIDLAWVKVQNELMSLVLPLWKENRTLNPMNAIIYLKDSLVRKKVISIENVKILLDMYDLRNRVVGKGYEANITSHEALEYVQLAERMLVLLSSIKRSVQEVNLATIKPYEFEQLVNELFEKIFSNLHTDLNDTGFAPNFTKEDKFLIDIKQYRRDAPVSVATVRDLYGRMTYENATKGILVTTSYFTNAAKELAQNIPIQLIDGTELLSLFKKYGYNVKSES